MPGSRLSHSGVASVSHAEMNDADPLALSSDALVRLLGEALHVGVSAAPPETPEWWQDPAFPYVPVSFVGRGGSGFVWKASRRDGRGYVGLKLVPFRSDPVRLRQRWEDECAALEKIQHRNLVALADHGPSPDGLSGWLAMEWIEGDCLGRKLQKEGRLSFKDVMAIVPQAIAGLSALHKAGLIHRDIKPSNLLLETESGRLVIADLGIAVDLGGDPDQRVTRTSEHALTPGYFPPELLQSASRPTALGDQYSLAFTLWQLLTGTMPLGAFAKLHHLCKCPDTLDAVFRKALANDPSNRFPDLEAFGQALHQAELGLPRPFLYLGIMMPLLVGGIAFLVTRPEPFPKHFQSGRISSPDSQRHFSSIEMTLEKTGQIRARIRTTSLHPLFGFAGKCRIAFRDSKGATIRQITTPSYGVNGRFIFGSPHDRVDKWEKAIPPEDAARVHSVHFSSTTTGWTIEERARDNRRAFENDLKKIRNGASKGM
ncbi:MAG: serine/threonine protein kinase, partial [Verrucomicrobiaceae bacterium]